MSILTWDDYMDGRVMVKLAESLWEFSEQCPEEGTDRMRIGEWHDLFDSFVMLGERTAYFVRWEDGIPLLKAIDAHHSTAIDADALPTPFWQELTRRCGALAHAARERWPEPPDDDDEEGDDT